MSRKKQTCYAIRSELNQRWEKVFEHAVRHLCDDNNLVVDQQMVYNKRVPWEKTWDKLVGNGYRLLTRSFSSIQTEFDRSKK